MSSHGVFFLVLTALLPLVITEPLLFLCWRSFGTRGAYPWYSCLLRTAAYSPCLLLGSESAIPLPLSSAFVLSLGRTGGQLIWLYGLPEVFVGIVCVLVSYGVRLVRSPTS